MTQLFQAQIEFVSIVYKMYLHHFCGCAGCCGHVARAAVPKAPKRIRIPWGHTITASYMHTTCSHTLLPTSQTAGKLPASETETTKDMFTVNSSGVPQGCNKDDTSRCNHFYVGTKHFLLLETALSPLGQEQHEETPEPRCPQASTWLVPGWGLKAVQPHACRPRPQQCLAMQRQCFQSQHRLMQSQPRHRCTHGPLTPATRQALSCILCTTQQFLN